MEHVEDHHGVGAAVVYVTDIAVHDLHRRARIERKGTPRAGNFPRIDLDSRVLAQPRRLWPAVRPGPRYIARMTGACGEQPRGEQSLSATEIQDPAASAQKSARQDGRECRV